jgi:hypothetical protein
MKVAVKMLKCKSWEPAPPYPCPWDPHLYPAHSVLPGQLGPDASGTDMLSGWEGELFTLAYSTHLPPPQSVVLMALSHMGLPAQGGKRSQNWISWGLCGASVIPLA